MADSFFPKVKKSITDFLYEEEGNIPRNKLLTLGSMILLLSILYADEAFAGHRSHSSHSSHGSHGSSSHGSSHGSHSSHESHSSHQSVSHSSHGSVAAPTHNSSTIITNPPTSRVTPKPTAKPTATPKPTVKPTATPKPTVKPTATPKPTVKPTATPKPTVKPTATPHLTSLPNNNAAMPTTVPTSAGFSDIPMPQIPQDNTFASSINKPMELSEYSARDCAARPLKLSIHSGGIEHACRRR